MTYLCGIVAAMFMTTCLVAGTVRWLHMCRPFDRHPDYYYPGRLAFTSMMLNSVWILPYILAPGSEDAWYLVRVYFFPVTLFGYVVLLFSYFGSVMQWRRWFRPAVVSCIPIFSLLVGATVLAIWPGDQIGSLVSIHLATVLLYTIGAVSTVLCAICMTIIIIWASRFDRDDFSNPADFPLVSAERWLIMALCCIVLGWIAALADNRIVMAVLQLIYMFVIVFLLVTILHPNRYRRKEEPELPAEAPAAPAARPRVPRNKRAEILAAIRTVLEERQGYQDAHLTIQQVADMCGYSRTYVAGVFKDELGGFFTYVNTLRLRHVEAYLKEHPDATVQEAAEESGFTSRQAYYSVKNRLG